MSSRGAARAPRAPARVDTRACPAGAARGVDVARMFHEIELLTRAYASKHAGDIDVEDLVQEVAVAIATKNASEKSAFDPARSSFGHYVTLVARSKAGHVREKRYHFGEIPTADETLEHAHDAGVREGHVAKRDAVDRRTMGELVEMIREAERAATTHARALRATDAIAAARAEGIAEASRKYSALLDGAFEPDVALPPARPAAPRAPAPDPHAGLRQKLAAALERWRAAVACEDARVRETLAAALARMPNVKRPRRVGSKRRALERLLATPKGRATSPQALARRVGTSERYVRRVRGEGRNCSGPPQADPHEQKRAAIAAAIAADRGASNREIARRVGCDHKTVGVVRSDARYLRGTSKRAAVAAAARAARRS